MTHGQPQPGPDPGNPHQTSPKQGGTHQIGRYDVVKELGRGAMGHVYMARQREIQRLVAIKVMRPDVADEVAAQRFRREAEMMARLRHPGIVSVFDFGSHGKTPYFVMDYVEGQSLADPIRKGFRFSHRQILETVRDLSLALHHAHAQGIIHRDLKPSNVLLTADGRPIITDFGLAADQLRPANLTATGFVVGTPLYMAPEQATGKGPVDALSDIYSLGVILFELLTGWNPRNAQSVGSVMRKAARNPLPAPSSIEPSVPASFDTMTLRATNHDRSRRHASAQLLASQAEALLQQLGSDHQITPNATATRPEGASGPHSVAPPGLAAASGPPKGRIYHDHAGPLDAGEPRRLTTMRVTAGTSAILALALIGGWIFQVQSTGTQSRQPPPSSTEQRLLEERLKLKQERLKEQHLEENRLQEQRARQQSLIKEAQTRLAELDGANECLEILRDTDLDLEGLAEYHALRARTLTIKRLDGDAEEEWAQAFEIQPTLVLEHLHSDLSLADAMHREAMLDWIQKAAQSGDAPANKVAQTVLESWQADPDKLKIARAMLDNIVKDHPDYPIARRELAHILWRLGEWNKALQVASQLVSRWPDDARHHTMSGRFLRSLRHWREAREALTEARSLRPDLPGPHIELGQLNLETFQIDEARQDFARGARLAPRSILPLVGEARALLLSVFGAGVSERATWMNVTILRRPFLERAQKIDPNNARVHVELGIDSSFLKPREAQDHFEKALAADPREAEVHRLAISLILRGMVPAGQDLRTALEHRISEWQAQTPDPVEPWLGSAEILAFSRRGQLAFDYFRRALDLAPADAQAWLRLASLELRPNDLAPEIKIRNQILHLGNAWESDRELLQAWSKHHARHTDTLQTYLEALGGWEALLQQREQVTINQLSKLNQAHQLWESGDPGRALEKLVDCAETAPGSPLPHGRVVAWVTTHQPIMDSLQEGQRLELALKHGELAVETCKTSGFMEYEPWALAHRAVAELKNGLRNAGKRSYSQATQLLDQDREPRNRDLDKQARVILQDLEDIYGYLESPTGPGEDGGGDTQPDDQR